MCIAAWVRVDERRFPASPRTNGARRCTNPECKNGGRWIVREVDPGASCVELAPGELTSDPG